MVSYNTGNWGSKYLSLDVVSEEIESCGYILGMLLKECSILPPGVSLISEKSNEPFGCPWNIQVSAFHIIHMAVIHKVVLWTKWYWHSRFRLTQIIKNFFDSSMLLMIYKLYYGKTSHIIHHTGANKSHITM